jgi:hypothetical protein
VRAETAPAAQTTPQSRQACEEEAASQDLNWPEFDMRRERDFERAYGPEDEQRTPLPQVRATRGTAPKGERTRRSHSDSGLATLLVALIMVLGSAAAVFWQWPAITEFYVSSVTVDGSRKVRPAIKSRQRNPNCPGGFRSSRVALRREG